MHSKIPVSKIVRLILITTMFLLLIFFSSKGVFSPVRQLFLKIAYPFQKTFYLASEKTNDTLVLLSSIAKLKNQNEKLIKENNILSSQIVNLQDQKKENEVLRQQLKLAPRNKYNLEAALVIGQDTHGLGSWIMLDKGDSSGIKTGRPVIASGVLVGKIDKVYANSSKVTLLTDSSSSINVSDLATGAKGILVGKYNLGLVMGMVEQTEALNPGDDVITSALGKTLPEGLLIGKVQQVSNTPDKLFQQAIIIPKVKYSNLKMVFVIK